jgi:hypothetical protein
MPEKALDATVVAPLREGASMLQAVAERLTALTTGVDERFESAVNRLQALPSAARLDPFAVMAEAAGAVSGAVADGAAGVAGWMGEAAGGGRPVTARNRKPQAAGARPAGAAASASQAAVQRIAQDAAGDEDSLSSVIGLPGRLAVRFAEQLAHAALQAPVAPAAGAGILGSLPDQLRRRAAGQAGQRPAAAAGGQAQRVFDEAAHNRLLEVLRRVGFRTHAPAVGAPAGRGHTQQAPNAALHLVQLLRKLAAGVPARATGRPAQQGSGAGRIARPPAGQDLPTPAPALPAATPARRAQSLLLGSAAAAAGAATGLRPRNATAEPAGAPAVPSAPGPAPQADTDDVIAEINRLLVDQAWLRGVDLR